MADLLGHGKEIDIIWPVALEEFDESIPFLIHLLADSKQGAKIFQGSKAACGSTNDTVVPIWIVLWSDDMEPNSSKANRGSVWVLSATIATPHKILNSAINTYVLAMGPKGIDHDFIFEKVSKDLKYLSSGAEMPPFTMMALRA